MLFVCYGNKKKKMQLNPAIFYPLCVHRLFNRRRTSNEHSERIAWKTAGDGELKLCHLILVPTPHWEEGKEEADRDHRRLQRQKRRGGRRRHKA